MRGPACHGPARAACLAVLGLALLGGILVPAASAAWTEGDATILTLNEALPALRAGLDASVSTSLPGDTPVLLPAGTDPADIKALRAALVLSGLALAEERGAMAVTRPHTYTDAERAARRHYDVTPQALGRGADGAIERGGALLFGRLLAPPFRVEATAEAVFVNGVAVYPSPGASAPPPAVTAADEEAFALLEAAIEGYHRDRGALGAALARDRCRDAMAALPGVASAAWRSDDEIVLTRADGTEEGVVLTPRPREATPPTPEEVAEHMAATADDLAAALAAGHTVVAGATYLLTVDETGAAALRARLDAILAAAEPEALTLARLQARLGHRDAAADLLYAR